MTYHKPVLLNECIEGLKIKPAGIYADLTFGGGGHSKAILQSLGKKGRLFGFDQDIDAMINVPKDRRFTFVHSNFRYLRNFMTYFSVDKLDGILADLGISSHHIDNNERGFSYMKDTELDMRMNKSSGLTAAEVINNYPATELQRVFREYGELRNTGYLTELILKARKFKPLKTSFEFILAIDSFLTGKNRYNILSRIFQALRIEVNDELGALRDLLSYAYQLLSPEGRMVIITYHSLEDRIVKNFFRAGNFEGVIEKDFYGKPKVLFKLINKNPIVPSASEKEENPRSGSAKLRIAEKI